MPRVEDLCSIGRDIAVDH